MIQSGRSPLAADSGRVLFGVPSLCSERYPMKEASMATTTTPHPDHVRSSVAETNRRFMDAIGRGDADGAADVYTDDARLLPPDMPMIDGKAAARSLWSTVIQQMGLRAAQLETVDLQVSGDTAYEIGRYALTIQPAGAEAVTARGKFVVIWKQEGDAWKWHVDIWNSDAPAR